MCHRMLVFDKQNMHLNADKSYTYALITSTSPQAKKLSQNAVVIVAGSRIE